MSYTVRDVSDADLDAIIDVRNRSFGMTSDVEAWKRGSEEFIAARRFLAVHDDNTVVAAARMWDFAQWWGGRTVRMAGVAGVVVAPEHRGQGAATLLMRAVHDRSVELGFPISALYPATLPPYRRLGYEFAGARHRFTFEAEALRGLGARSADVRQGGPDDAARLLDVMQRCRTAESASGMLAAGESSVRERLAEADTFCYLTDDGFVMYRWHNDDLQVEELVSGSEATARALWATVGSGASIAKRVHAYVGPEDPIHLLAPQEAVHDNRVERCMLRVLDVPKAMAARGWPDCDDMDVALTVEDPDLPANSGNWLLQIHHGKGTLTRGGKPGLRIGARGLAALYAGCPTSALRVGGLLSGGTPAAERSANLAFGIPSAYLLDYF